MSSPSSMFQLPQGDETLDATTDQPLLHGPLCIWMESLAANPNPLLSSNAQLASSSLPSTFTEQSEDLNEPIDLPPQSPTPAESSSTPISTLPQPPTFVFSTISIEPVNAEDTPEATIPGAQVIQPAASSSVLEIPYPHGASGPGSTSKDNGKGPQGAGPQNFVPPTSINIEYILPGGLGDVNIVVGTHENARRFRVSSIILSCASPVFAAMFKHDLPKHYQQTLKAGKEANFILPDDDPEAMESLFQLAHYRTLEDSDLVLETIEEIAIACDKFQFANTLQPWTSKWLKHWGLNGSFSDTVKRLCLTYAFHDHEHFAAASKALFCEYSEVEVGNVGGDEEDCGTLLAILPESFFSVLMERRRKNLKEVHAQIEHMVYTQAFDNWNSCSPPLPPHKQRLLCDKPVKLAYIVQELSRIGVFPLVKLNERSSLASVLENLEKYENYKDSLGLPACSCLQDIDVKGNLKMIADNIRQYHTEGLCITCVKNDRFIKDEGNCLGVEKCEFGGDDTAAEEGKIAPNHARGYFAEQGARSNRGAGSEDYFGGRGYHGASGRGGRGCECGGEQGAGGGRGGGGFGRGSGDP